MPINTDFIISYCYDIGQCSISYSVLFDVYVVVSMAREVYSNEFSPYTSH